MPQVEGPFGNTFGMSADEISISLSKDKAMEIAPSMIDSKVSRLVEAAEEHAFKSTSGTGANELHFLSDQIAQVASIYIKEGKQGRVVLNSYDRFFKLIKASALHLIKENAGAKFKGRIAEGSDQFLMRQICMDTFNLSAGNREQSTGGTGYIASYIDGYNPDDRGWTDEQNIFILGEIMTTDPTVLEGVVNEIDDNKGKRSRIDTYNAVSIGDMYFVPYNTPLWIENDDSYSRHLIAEKSEVTDIFPVGVDLISANHKVTS